MFNKIKSKGYADGRFLIPRHFSAEVGDLIERMLVPDPIARICSSQIKYHPWLKEEGRKIPRRVSYPKEIAEYIIEECLKLPHFSKYTKSKAV